MKKTSIIIAHYINIIIKSKDRKYPDDLIGILNCSININTIPDIRNNNLLRVNSKLVNNIKKQDEYFELYNLGSFLQNPHWMRWMMLPSIATITMCGILAITANKVINQEIKSEDICRASYNAAATKIFDKTAEAARLEGRTTEQIEQGRKDASNLMIQGIIACHPRYPDINFIFKAGGMELGIKTGEDIKPIT